MRFPPTEPERQTLRMSRASHGRMLGGVCAGLNDAGALGTRTWRWLFLLAALCGGIGIIAYVACWLVVPPEDSESSDSDSDSDSDSVRGVVLVAWASGALVVIVLTAGLSAVITVFGLGWVVVGLAAVVLAFGLSPVGRRIPGAAVLAVVGSLALPAMAVALSPVRINLQDGATVSRPSTAAAISATVFESGFGTQLIDLRHTRLPSSGAVTLQIRAGLRRTIVALPSDRCVHVTVNYAIHSFASQLATLLSGRNAAPFPGVVLFGALYGLPPSSRQGIAQSRGTDSGPTLKINFISQGGSLYVRDYPDDVSAETDPNWPGFAVTPEPRPDLRDEPRKVAKQMLVHWHQRLVREITSRHYVDRLIPGPCAN